MFKRTLSKVLTRSGKSMAFDRRPSFLDRGVPSPNRLKPTRFAADVIQVLPGGLLDVLFLGNLAAVCLLDESVGDMKWGDLQFPRFSSCLIKPGAGGVFVASTCCLVTLLAFAVISANVPISTHKCWR